MLGFACGAFVGFRLLLADDSSLVYLLLKVLGLCCCLLIVSLCLAPFLFPAIFSPELFVCAILTLFSCLAFVVLMLFPLLVAWCCSFDDLLADVDLV